MAPARKPEDRAREKIDGQLSAAGWQVQSRDEVDLDAARGVAIREFRMAPKHGVADYLLFVDGHAVGALEQIEDVLADLSERAEVLGASE